MCGIVGYVGNRACVPLLVAGLRRLEYRGYDSAGIAVLDRGQLEILRSRGKLENLERLLQDYTPAGTVGMGHTRWATHGRPSDENAHPHRSGSIAVVHNGIIENHAALRAELIARGRNFTSETDTEIVAHLIDEALQNQGESSLQAAVRRALAQVRGAYAIVVMSDGFADEIVVAKNASPLVIGLGEGENYVASDIPAILPYTRRVIFLEEGELAVLRPGGVQLFTLEGKAVSRVAKEISWSIVSAEKAGFKHFMLKEIHEQDRALTDTLRGRISVEQSDVFLDDVELSEAKIDRVVILGCGTSWHAGLGGKYAMEELAQIPVEVDLASEYRYRNPIVGPRDLVLAISQSGETADTLAAMREAKAKGARTLCISNVVDSSIARAVDGSIYTHAGPEIGVASTKAFTTQMAALVLLSIHLGRRRKTLSETQAADLLRGLLELPHRMAEALSGADKIAAVARKFSHARHFLFLGRGNQYPIALEGALKLKEISYIHAEGYAAGEMKHGPIALIDEEMPIVGLVPEGGQREKTMSNLQEVRARQGRIIAVTSHVDAQLESIAEEIIVVPQTLPVLQPFLTVLPLQLFAYYMADFMGNDVDQPRNLAKSVTVE